jgi:phenylacetate-coenzyme A ligase PaaK-like adenylate-forming protein
MEYGSMESGVMAYQTPITNGRYKVFDNTHLMHIGKGDEDSSDQIFVTSLTRRYLPLIRYRIGDFASDSYIREDGTVDSFSEVTGRVGDMIDLGNGVRFHGYSLMVCAEENSKIIAYQLKVNKKIGDVIFLAQTLLPLSSNEILKIQKHAADVASIAPECIKVEEVTELIKAPSGKIRLVIEES